jgi:hypothetical protein
MASRNAVSKSSPASDSERVTSHFFVTIDAETEMIREGIRIISELREEVEARARIRIPLVWFVRFQRGWTECVENDSVAAFEDPPTDGYDGFALARRQLLGLRARGDEIGWHYHAYNYVHRVDLSHETRLEILRADLRSCALELRRRHPDLPVGSFRFGWFFVPDYAIYDQFKSLGITRDASIRPHSRDRSVANSVTRYLAPLVTAPARIDGLSLFPFSQTMLLHDWDVVPHKLSWSHLDRHAARAQRLEFASELATIARRLKGDHGAFLTYETAPRSLIRDAGRV